MIAIALLATSLVADPAELLGHMTHKAIREASGIVQSRRHPGIFWVHNDSGNPPALFAVTKTGKLVREFAVSVPNIDWEDITIDDHGHLFLGDIGNNGQKLPLRMIYRFDEPDPHQAESSSLKPSLVTFYQFPKDGRFDAEGLYLDGGKAVVVAKYRDGREANLFTIALDPSRNHAQAGRTGEDRDIIGIHPSGHGGFALAGWSMARGMLNQGRPGLPSRPG